MPDCKIERKKNYILYFAAFFAVALAAACLAAYAGLYPFARVRARLGALVPDKGSADDFVAVASESDSAEAFYLDPEFVRSEKEWFLLAQMPDGAIAQTPQGELVIPYFANIAARTLVGIEPERAREYLSWYIASMNVEPDRRGLSGTIYDFVRSGEELVPTYRYDSADSYAATFLSLVAEYYHKTGDAAFVGDNLSAIDLAAQAILSLQDADGLIRVMPGSRSKYLMDNCECYRGLVDWAEVLEALLETEAVPEGVPIPDPVKYISAASVVKDAIDSELWDEGVGSYAWALTWYGKRFPLRGKWYPDAVSQIDLISCGILDRESERAAILWEQFVDQFPLWQEGETGDQFPWAKIAVTAALMGDVERAKDFLGWAKSKYHEEGRPYPWHVLESASTLEAAVACFGP